MGVIKRNENLFNVKYTISEETLYIPSSDDETLNYWTEEEVQTQQHVPNLRPRPPTIGSTFSTLKNHSGKKKFRRYHNAHQLLTLTEEDELQEVTIEDFIENSKSGFSILLNDEEALEKWNEFISSSEEHQRKLLENDKKKHAFPRPAINKTLRSLLRKKSVPLGMVEYFEGEIISFFSAEPQKIYISPVLSSFERLLLHSVSDYHHLASLKNAKLVRVENPKNEFPLPSLLLVQYLKSNYRL
ncbi:conserved hypothetical protein [Pediculus humanus corporis]|uniref:R3H-associated N-terminal domain-containing protein n=1 Tax=Pediculus humanus subsp. corporis TaxID=121224 RepID=E0VCU8_PEDHC|nr:uncharacterized protein Phum_PHUM097910 [Pediculus humanus corporis]EEB11204.1 conserved hypothetical protein [Pediculus humanus corporis]